MYTMYSNILHIPISPQHLSAFHTPSHSKATRKRYIRFTRVSPNLQTRCFRIEIKVQPDSQEAERVLCALYHSSISNHSAPSSAHTTNTANVTRRWHGTCLKKLEQKVQPQFRYISGPATMLHRNNCPITEIIGRNIFSSDNVSDG